MKAWNYFSSGWTNFSLPKNIQKRLYKFLLRKAIGQFLQNELDLENFDIGLMNGSVELRDLDLNLQTLNKLLKDTPFILESGRVASIHASIPWSTFWSGDISLKIQGLQLALHPMKNKPKMDESIHDENTTDEPIMSSSLHFADDFLKSELDIDQELNESIQKSFEEQDDMEGLQVLTKVIDKMLAKIKIDIIETMITIIHKSAVPLSTTGDEYHLQLNIPRISYFDETPEFNSTTNANINMVESSVLLPPMANETIKCVKITCPEIWLTEPDLSDSMYSIPQQSTSETTINSCLSETQFFDTLSDNNSMGSLTPTQQKHYHHQKYKALLFTTLNEKSFIRLKLRPTLDNPIKQLDFLVTHVRFIITPLQAAFFLDLMNAMTTSSDTMETAATPVSTTAASPSENNNSSININGMKTAVDSINPLLDDLDVYNHQQQSTLFLPAEQDVTSPDIKIKIKTNCIELLALTDDKVILDWKQPQENKTHILFALQHLNIKHEQFNQGNSTINIKIGNILLNEWIKQPLIDTEGNPNYKTRYKTYNPIFKFDNSIKSCYDDQALFPEYNPKNNINQHQDRNDVIRIRIDRKKTQYINTVTFDQDIYIEIQPFILNIDPRIIDRCENYILSIQDNNQQQQQGKEQQRQSSSFQQPLSNHNVLTKQKANRLNTKLRVKCAFIRIVLFVPDMSQTSTREEFNDKFHKNQLSIDIKKLAVTWSSHAENTLNRLEPIKLNVELNYLNVFMHSRQDMHAKCWFTAKTAQGKKYFTEGALCPTVEILIQDNSTVYVTNVGTRFNYFGAGSDIPQNLFNFLSQNENFNAEQKLHVPMEDQSESAYIFKQKTMETSVLALNCHLPSTNMNLTKDIWDKVQIIQNDLLLWQPRFLIVQQQQDDISSSMHSSSMMSHERLSFSPRQYYARQEQQCLKTLVAVNAVMSTGVWNIHATNINNYKLLFSDFKYFAAIKHLGQNENITTLDIDELSLTDISNPTQPIPLLYKTIPKTIHPKRDTSMVSLFSRLISYPEVNRLSKATSIVACNICWKASTNIDFISQIVDFQKVPPDMVFIDPPTQYIKIYAHILDTSIDYKPVHSPSRAVVVLDGIQVITDILAGQSFIDIKTFIQTIEMFLIDDDKETAKQHGLDGKRADARKYWSSLGLTYILTLLNIELQVKLRLDEHAVGPQVQVDLVSTDIGLNSCSDSFQTFLNLITYCANQGDNKQSPAPPQPQLSKKYMPHQINTKHGNDLLASLDENAFRTSPTSSKISPPTLIEAPDMEDFNYVEEFYKSDFKKPSPPMKPRRKQPRIKTADDIIRVLISPDDDDEDNNGLIHIVDDYFGIEKKVVEPQSVVDITKAIVSLRVSNVNVVWKLYDGYSWDYIKSEMKKDQDGFFEEDYRDAYVDIKLDAISVNFDLMPAKDATALYFHLLIKDVEIIDNIKTSTWKKFLGYMPTKDRPRELDACMVDLELISLRPVTDDPQQEFRLKVKLLPIRLYVDQDALNFLVKYFTFDKALLKSTKAANQSIYQHQEHHEKEEEEDEAKSESTGMFFQHVDIYPITLKVDYKPKYINYGNIKEGQLAELVNLFHLDGAEMSLTHVKFSGIKDMDGLLERLSHEWLPHIMNTQVGNVVSGVSPIRSIVNLGNGVADLILLPIQQYKKDGRLIKGIQRGTSSFARATAIEAIKLSTKMATGTQVILEHADGFFSPASASTSSTISDQPFVYTDIYGMDVPNHDDEEEARRRRGLSISPTPSDLSEGIQFAYQNLSKNLGSAAQTIFAVPTEIAQDRESYDTGGSSSNTSTRNGVIRAVPVAVIKPMIGLTGAFQSILTGLRNSIDPVMRLQSEDKYKRRK